MRIQHCSKRAVTAASVGKSYYFAESERFGYTLHCVGATEKEVEQAMIEAYVNAYKDENGFDPREEEFDDYETFLDELYIEKREYGKVYWD